MASHGVAIRLALRMKTSLTSLLATLFLTGNALAADAPAPDWGALELLQRTIPVGEKRKFSFQQVPTSRAPS